LFRVVPAQYAGKAHRRVISMTRKKLILSAGVLLAGGLLIWIWLGHGPTGTPGIHRVDADGDIPSAAVARVEGHNIGSTLSIAGEFKPFQDVAVHAKVAGYIRQIYVDVGDRVKEGQTIAVLEVPELAAQLTGAEAAVRAAQEQVRKALGDLQRAKSAHAAGHSAYTRLKQAADSRAGLVAQQEVDDSEAKDLETEGQAASAEAEIAAAKQQLEMAQANRKQYAAMAGYTRIVAPFAGVITNRYADTGALIAAGTSSSTQALPVVRLAETSKLRLVLPVPESVAGQIHLGDPVKVRVQALDQEIEGRVSRFADSLDRQTRTMETEIDFDNHAGRLIPGMYTEARLSLREKKNALTIPLEAISRNGEEATVLAVNADNIVEERKVRLGLEDSTRVEVLSGLKEGERVIIGNRSEYHSGEKIQPKDVSGGAARTGSER
jgi:RND family efflux transporter MFP subunit